MGGAGGGGSGGERKNEPTVHIKTCVLALGEGDSVLLWMDPWPQNKNLRNKFSSYGSHYIWRSEL